MRLLGGRRARGDRPPLPVWQELVLLLLAALVIAVVVKTWLLQAFYVPSASMDDTLVPDDRILVEKPSYWSGGPQRGDVVVFSDPGGWLDPAQARAGAGPVGTALGALGLHPVGGHLVKRVIGVGGDEVRCCDAAGRITVNGVPLHERSYLPPGQRPSLVRFDVEVSPGYLWVQGDNRSSSADSRAHLGDPGGGQVPVEDVVGKVFAVVWPFGHAKTLSTPATFGSLSRP